MLTVTPLSRFIPVTRYFQAQDAVAAAVRGEIPMDVQNLLQMFDYSVAARGEGVCFRYVENGAWLTLSWSEAKRRVMQIAGGLKKLGIQKGDRVAILSKTRFEWTLADLGILAAGGVVVPIYESSIGEQVQYILENSGAKAVFVENKTQYQKVREVQETLPQLKNIVYFGDVKAGASGVYSLEELQMLGTEDGARVYEKFLKSMAASDEVSFVYTSGTTGNPKGAVLTHANFLAELRAFVKIFKFESHYESVLFLPLAHIFARVVQYCQLAAGFVQAYAESIDRLTDNIATVRPHFIGSVPRIFEKIHSRTLQGIESASPAKKKIFKWAYDVGLRRARLVFDKKAVPLWLKLQDAVAYKLVFSKLHARLGGRIKFFISGGAPLPVEVATFFSVFGFPILEGYGLTETTAAITINRMDDIALGTVGQIVPGCEIKIAEDGEILAKGELVFSGYHNAPEATQEVFTEDGWFKTGDIGTIDADGRLKITDRKKDLIITAGGKNIAPQNIESLIKSDPYISQFVVHGDRRKFLSALVTLDRPEVEKLARQRGIQNASYAELVRSPEIHAFIKERIEGFNKTLAKYETIKKFEILPEDFSVESGELTPTLKVKRKVINQRYKDVFDSFYNE